MLDRLDSYECTNCGSWSHYPQAISDDESTPLSCPYCAHETLDTTLVWRSDTMYALKEIGSC